MQESKYVFLNEMNGDRTDICMALLTHIFNSIFSSPHSIITDSCVKTQKHSHAIEGQSKEKLRENKRKVDQSILLKAVS